MDIPILGPILRWLQALFFSKHLQIAILGLQSAGKTSLVNVISSGQFSEEMVPTVGFNVSRPTPMR
jgi:ADP-ribosylation factor-like protein 8